MFASYQVPIYTPGSRAAMWIKCLAEGQKYRAMVGVKCTHQYTTAVTAPIFDDILNLFSRFNNYNWLIDHGISWLSHNNLFLHSFTYIHSFIHSFSHFMSLKDQERTHPHCTELSGTKAIGVVPSYSTSSSVAHSITDPKPEKMNLFQECAVTLQHHPPLEVAMEEYLPQGRGTGE